MSETPGPAPRLLGWLATVQAGDEVAVSDTRRVVKLARVESRDDMTVTVAGGTYSARNGMSVTVKPNSRQTTRVSVPRILPADDPVARRRMAAQDHDEAAQQVGRLAVQFHGTRSMDDWHALNITVQRWLKHAREE